MRMAEEFIQGAYHISCCKLDHMMYHLNECIITDLLRECYPNIAMNGRVNFLIEPSDYR